MTWKNKQTLSWHRRANPCPELGLDTTNILIAHLECQVIFMPDFGVFPRPYYWAMQSFRFERNGSIEWRKFGMENKQVCEVPGCPSRLEEISSCLEVKALNYPFAVKEMRWERNCVCSALIIFRALFIQKTSLQYHRIYFRTKYSKDQEPFAVSLAKVWGLW
jgi:hypothetical protein